MRNYVTLYDLALRHQLYIERLKTHYVAIGAGELMQLDSTVRRLIAGIKYDTLDGLTRKELNSFLAVLRKQQSRIYNGYLEKVIKMLADFMALEIGVQAETLVEAVNQHFAEDDEDDEDDDFLASLNLPARLTQTARRRGAEDGQEGPLLLPLVLTAAGSAASLWASWRNAPMGANGALPEAFLRQFLANSNARIEASIRMSWANKESKQQAVARILGNPNVNQANGDLNVINGHSKAVINTIVQSINTAVNSKVTPIIIKRYRWVSVIDGVTSLICRQRHNQEYVYGSGPIPPAHPNCRSCIEPIVGKSKADVRSFREWFEAQPDAIKADLRGSKTVAPDELAKYIAGRPITPAEYRNKVSFIVNPN